MAFLIFNHYNLADYRFCEAYYIRFLFGSLIRLITVLAFALVIFRLVLFEEEDVVLVTYVLVLFFSDLSFSGDAPGCKFRE